MCLDKFEYTVLHSLIYFVTFRKYLLTQVCVGKGTVARVALSIDDVIDAIVYCYVMFLSMCRYA